MNFEDLIDKGEFLPMTKTEFKLALILLGWHSHITSDFVYRNNLESVLITKYAKKYACYYYPNFHKNDNMTFYTYISFLDFLHKKDTSHE